MNELIAKITSSSKVAIRSADAVDSLSQPLYAVNWFDASPQWLYHLYNRLAGRSVVKIGGQPLFKATVKDSLLSDKGKRQILLLVKYPDGQAFKNLLESTYFKIVSLLRIKSVQRFTFSFTKPASAFVGKTNHSHYAIHYFKDGDLNEVLSASEDSRNGLEIIYSGQTFAHIYRQEKGKPDEVVKSIIDNIIIYGAASEEGIKKKLTGKEYLQHFDSENPGYIATLNKIF